jgi:tetratricopeptide (TPR) repeat protein
VKTPHYKAFISYSHCDESWARWLQRSLENYRVPKRLVGGNGAYGLIPRRLNPIFRDREDLSSAADLTSQIKEELAESESLIVICSPAAASSHWVNEEVRRFREMGRSDRILALIVDGDPEATDPATACFPETLVQSTDGSRTEPLAADVRKYADGKKLASLKLVAGILGIRLDELRRRDTQRRTRRRIIYAMSIVILASIVGWLAYSAATSRAHARAQRANTEDLLGFMLGDLKRLGPIEGLEIIQPDDESQGQLHGQLGFDDMDDERLVSQALGWREAGIEHHQRGEIKAAMEQFIQSRAACIELYRREGSTNRALFELGQAAFFVGYIHFDQGELDAAEESWVRYGATTRRLLNAEPRNAKYVMELSYTLMNLGALEQSRPIPDSAKSLQLTQSSVQFNQMALVLDPDNLEYRNNLATNLAWLADAWLDKCGLGNAFKFRIRTVELRRELHLEYPGDTTQKLELAYMLHGLAGVQQQIGLNDSAMASFEESVQLLQELHEAEPDNANLEWQFVYRSGRLASHLMSLGETDAAWSMLSPLIERTDALTASAANIDHISTVESAWIRLDYARLLLLRGESSDAKRRLEDVIDQFTQLVREKPGYRESLKGLAHAYFEYWQGFGQKQDMGIEALLEGYLAKPEDVQNCHDADLAAHLAVVDGDRGLAKRYTRYVLERGYFVSDFVTFCREFDLCTRS